MFQLTTSTSSDVQSRANSFFSAYASFAASMMMVRSISNHLIPKRVRSYLQTILHYFFPSNHSTTLTFVIHELCEMTPNEMYEAAETYLSTKVSPSTVRLKVARMAKQKNIQVSVGKDEEITDTLENFQVKWNHVTIKTESGQVEKYYELRFDEKFKDKVMEEYLPYVEAKAQQIKDADKVVKLYSQDRDDCYSDLYEDAAGDWGSIHLDHPATFETLAMDPEMKKSLIEDLERFARRKDFYRKVGKAWKRGYLLYGPPGTGKTSLIAAMANYLKFDIYDLDLTSMNSNAHLRNTLLSFKNRSIIVIEDIDCSAATQDREYGGNLLDSKLTLSGLLNILDGLWSSCGDERIIIFTTNHKAKLDPALLRPGRMDMHIHMSYCTHKGFGLLAFNYLGANDHHRLFPEIKDLIKKVEVTPAEIAEELMKSQDADVALAGVLDFLGRKKIETSREVREEKKVTHEGNDNDQEKKADGS